jgi:S-adenosylmethionine synthetase
MENRRYLFTSESVGEGHPDKICDQIADAVLDACLSDDRESRVACEVFASTGMVLIGGEITTQTYVDFQAVARGVAKRIGYDRPEYGLDYNSMAVLSAVHSQSPDISQGVAGHGLKEFEGLQGAGDQGMMFGYACSETPELMPAPIMYAHKLLLRATEARKNGEMTFLRPDSKSQVTLEYENGKPVRIHTVVISHQHDDGISHAELSERIIKGIVEPVLGPTGLLDKATKYYVNPTGRFVIGGPQGDTGLTGRKLIVDSYGGMARHGGGAFSGKDPSKVDRSAAYMARYVAKNVVAAGVCERCEVALAYAIGVPFPISVDVDTFGTNKVPEARIEASIEKVFDLTPAGIVKALDLKRPIYRPTSTYGHFGRDSFSWEKSDRADEVARAAG